MNQHLLVPVAEAARLLTDRITELEAQLEAVGAGGVGALISNAERKGAATLEPFGYFKPEPFGWTDCAETDEGAIALYEAPPPQQIAEPAAVERKPLTNAQYTEPAPSAAGERADWDARGLLASNLKCWHRLTEEESNELVALLQSTALPDHSEQRLDMVAALPVGELTLPSKRDIGEFDPKKSGSTFFRGLGWNEAIDEVAGLLAAARPQPVLEPNLDTARLDWLETQSTSYGFEDMHEGNRWTIEGPFMSLRTAIDEGIAANKKEPS